MGAFALIASAVGSGVSFIGQMQQARAQQAIAAQNASLQMENARIESSTLRAQSEIQKITAAQNKRLAEAEGAARLNNAATLRERASIQDELNAINIRKKREEYGRVQATQKARYAAAGIVESTGSPLSMIAETAGLIQRDIGETVYANELQQQGLYREAALQRLGGEYALAGATLDYGSEMSEARLRESSASATLLTGQRQAQITGMAGRAQASGIRAGAFGNLLSSGAGLAAQHYQFKQWGAY